MKAHGRRRLGRQDGLGFLVAAPCRLHVGPTAPDEDGSQETGRPSAAVGPHLEELNSPGALHQVQGSSEVAAGGREFGVAGLQDDGPAPGRRFWFDQPPGR